MSPQPSTACSIRSAAPWRNYKPQSSLRAGARSSRDKHRARWRKKPSRRRSRVPMNVRRAAGMHEAGNPPPASSGLQLRLRIRIALGKVACARLRLMPSDRELLCSSLVRLDEPVRQDGFSGVCAAPGIEGQRSRPGSGRVRIACDHDRPFRYCRRQACCDGRKRCF